MSEFSDKKLLAVEQQLRLDYEATKQLALKIPQSIRTGLLPHQCGPLLAELIIIMENGQKNGSSQSEVKKQMAERTKNYPAECIYLDAINAGKKKSTSHFPGKIKAVGNQNKRKKSATTIPKQSCITSSSSTSSSASSSSSSSVQKKQRTDYLLKKEE